MLVIDKCRVILSNRDLCSVDEVCEGEFKF